MSMQIIFLGTAGSIPTPKRSLPAVLVKRQNEYIMFDAGEGVQKQMVIAKTGFNKKMKILITHMHGDHVLGLPGLLQTMALLDRQKPICIYGPPGITQFLEDLRETVQFALTYPLEIHEIEKPGIVCDDEEYVIRAVRSNHSIQGLVYALVEKPRPGRFYPEKAKALNIPEGILWSKLQKGQKVKLPDDRIVKPKDVMGPPRQGRKIVYTGDTRPFGNLSKLAADADLLIHDSTLGDDLADRAKEDGHSTPSQAARTAKRAKVKQLVLTHISARYSDPTVLLNQAKKTFKNTIIAEDFMRIEIPLLGE
ncbi:MAG TPA: ribonuclease Z [Patescibacteria group bacterium]|nr:ribonuclease Z [Patescibacteria group bacterium]